MLKKNFIIVTGNKYPEGDAGSVRQHSFAKILSSLGFSVIVIGMGESTGFKEKVFDGTRYFSLRYSNPNIIYRAMGRKFYSVNLSKILRKIGIAEISGILLVSADEATFQYIKKIGGKYNIQLYHDSVEWYSPLEFIKGEKDAEYIHNNKVNTMYIDSQFKVFAISSFLEKHFKNKEIECIRVPVIMDVDSVPYEKQVISGKIRFLYAGVMGGKDLIHIFIKAFEKLPPNEIKKIEFNLLGITYEDYRKYYGDVSSNLLQKVIFFYGRVPRSIVFEYMKKTDFTVLIRPDNARYAKAGFPTKVVESLAACTPVICNLTSDLQMYLKDNESAIIISECNEEACLNAIKRILSLSIDELNSMKISARRCFEDSFNWENYIKMFSDFVNK